MSTGSEPRNPSSSRAARISLMALAASALVSGTILKLTSLSTSTQTPPRPNMSTGPNCGSVAMPMMTSSPGAAMFCTVTPSMSASGNFSRHDAMMAW